MLSLDDPVSRNLRVHGMKTVANTAFFSEETRIRATRHKHRSHTTVWLKLSKNSSYDVEKRRFHWRFRRLISLNDFKSQLLQANILEKRLNQVQSLCCRLTWKNSTIKSSLTFRRNHVFLDPATNNRRRNSHSDSRSNFLRQKLLRHRQLI